MATILEGGSMTKAELVAECVRLREDNRILQVKYDSVREDLRVAQHSDATVALHLLEVRQSLPWHPFHAKRLLLEVYA